MVRLSDWREVINIDFPKDRPTTENTQRVMQEATNSGRYLIGDMRLATGRFYTTDEYESWRRKVLDKPLP